MNLVDTLLADVLESNIVKPSVNAVLTRNFATIFAQFPKIFTIIN